MAFNNQKNTHRKGKGGGRRAENSKIYAHPLPVIFSGSSSPFRSLRNLLGLSTTELLNPHVEGYLDVSTKSVWVINSKDAMILWHRGFFGKGDLSRSEPSWMARQISDRIARMKNKMTAEELTAKRRAERKQFKMDRAAAIAAVAADAEAIFETEGRVVTPVLSGPNIPSGATWKPKASNGEAPEPSVAEEDPSVEVEEPIEDLEHLQLTLPEAWFLAWNFDCLTILDPSTGNPLSLQQIWTLLQSVHYSFHLSISSCLSSKAELRFDNPFLINYCVYHHYRSLGWVIKSGIKFCVDYLLYKRGPVFNHAEFALVVCPVYEDPQDRENSPIKLQNIDPFEWSWLGTINRVNSQVMKTLVLTYVTIPAMSRVDSTLLDSPACFNEYAVREITVRRFIPARMRD